MGPDVRIHETAIIEDGATIGTGTAIWHHAHVRSGASIGSDCVIGKNVYIDIDTQVGCRVKIQNNVSVFAGVTLGDDVFVGPSAVFTNDLTPRAHNTDWSISSTIVDDGASIGANATVVCGHRIGNDSMVAAGSVVTRDVLPNELVAGNPARTLGWVARCGHVVSRGPEPPADLGCAQCVT